MYVEYEIEDFSWKNVFFYIFSISIIFSPLTVYNHTQIEKEPTIQKFGGQITNNFEKLTEFELFFIHDWFIEGSTKALDKILTNLTIIHDRDGKSKTAFNESFAIHTFTVVSFYAIQFCFNDTRSLQYFIGN